MIESINIRNCASYDSTGCNIHNLDKINVIYGGNGTGKTTISNFLKNNLLPQYSDCQIVWNHTPIDIVVYNKQFREENFTQGDIKGIFTLGTATQQDIATIRTKEQERDTVTEEGLRQKQTLDKRKLKTYFSSEKELKVNWINLNQNLLKLSMTHLM